MNAIVHQTQNVAIMTSREIAELTGKQHQHVKRDIENMLLELKEDVSKFGRIYLDSMNRDQHEYCLNRELTETLLTGYSAPLRRAVINRLRELEAQQPQFQVPTTLSSALRLAAEQADTIEKQAALLAEAKPAMQFVSQYVESTGLKGFRQVCKLLKAPEPEFRAFLHSEKIMYPLGGEWTPHANHIEACRFTVKAGTSETNGHAYNSALFTPKGVAWVAGEWAKYKLAQQELAA